MSSASPSGRSLAGNDALLNIGQVGIIDQFTDNTAIDRYNTIETDADAAVNLDADGNSGVVLLDIAAGAGGANQECYLYTNENFTFNYDRPMVAQTRVAVVPSESLGAAWCFGFTDSVAANYIADGGLDIVDDFQGCMFYKPYGSNSIYVKTSQDSATVFAQEQTENTMPSSTSLYTELRAQVRPHSDSHFEIIYSVAPQGVGDFAQCRAEAGRPPGQANLIKHYIRFNPSGKVRMLVGLKNVTDGESSQLRMNYWAGINQAYRATDESAA